MFFVFSSRAYFIQKKDYSYLRILPNKVKNFYFAKIDNFSSLKKLRNLVFTKHSLYKKSSMIYLTLAIIQIRVLLNKNIE